MAASAPTSSTIDRSRQVPPGDPSPLRPEEDRFLDAALAAGRGGQRVVELMGEPGAGKSRLLGDFARLARQRGRLVLRGSGGSGEPGLRCDMFVEALRRWLADRGHRDRRDAAAWLMRELAVGPFPAGPSPANSVVDDRCRTFSAVTGLLDDWAAHRSDGGGGLALVLDDVHAADSGSLELLEYLLRWPTEAPVSIVVAHRPAQTPPRLRGLLAERVEDGTAVSVELGPLSLAQSARLTGLPADSPRLRSLHHASRGVPLYLLALDRWPAFSGDDLEGDAWLDRGPALPSVFTARAEAELEPLTREERLVAAAAAVLGDTFDLAAVSAVSGLTEGAACRVVERLQRLDVVRAVDRGDHRFRHPLLRRVLYQETDPCWRLGAHRRALTVLVARAAPVQTLALHVERSVPGSAPEDIGVLAAAAHDSMRAGDLASAGERLALALRLVGGDGADIRGRAAARHGAQGRAAAARTARCRAEQAAELLQLAEQLTARTGRRALRDEATRLVRHIDVPAPREAASGRRAASREAADRLTGLTTREREVAEIAATGKRTRDIAAHLRLSPRTVDVHLSRIYRKLGVTSRAELARFITESLPGRTARGTA
ncbi:helix-turn-helix transcriptional regulator [Streptomyces incarnatus]|uniref:helix-turn-helix transcriptional regulator n=1 Tax=Streptomyces incarnatus TaxID=665007 RepID=UPI001AD804D7|nr:LuxR family transcriptional regulator [Streptomyces incarnatus]